MVSSKYHVLGIMNSISFLSTLTSPPLMLTHYYLSSTLVVSWSISLFMFMTLSLQVIIMVSHRSSPQLLPNDSLSRILSPSFVFLKLKHRHEFFFSLNIDKLKIFQLTLACHMPNQSPYPLLRLQLLNSTLYCRLRSSRVLDYYNSL